MTATLNVAARPVEVPPRPSSPAVQQPTVMRLLPPDGWVLDYLGTRPPTPT